VQRVQESDFFAHVRSWDVANPLSATYLILR
jgi:hypothetical protein